MCIRRTHTSMATATIGSKRCEKEDEKREERRGEAYTNWANMEVLEVHNGNCNSNEDESRETLTTQGSRRRRKKRWEEEREGEHERISVWRREERRMERFLQVGDAENDGVYVSCCWYHITASNGRGWDERKRHSCKEMRKQGARRRAISHAVPFPFPTIRSSDTHFLSPSLFSRIFTFCLCADCAVLFPCPASSTLIFALSPSPLLFSLQASSRPLLFSLSLLCLHHVCRAL